ncbi:MAG: hypothetical protein ACFCUO_12580 [Rhodospirillales bacterium]
MELRKIFFSSEEVELAATGYCYEIGRPVPPADHIYATFRDDIDAMVTLHFCRSGTPEPVTLALTRGEVNEALVGFCKEIGLPLPRAGKKVLWPHGDGIALMITLESRPPRELALAPAMSVASRATAIDEPNC